MRPIIWVLAAWLMSITLVSRVFPLPGIGYLVSLFLVPIGSKLSFKHILFLVTINFCFASIIEIDLLIPTFQIIWTSLVGFSGYAQLNLNSSLLFVAFIAFIGGNVWSLFFNALSIKYLSRFRSGIIKKMSKNLDYVIREFPDETKR